MTIYFLGNSFCRLCHSSTDALLRELDVCSKGLNLKGLLLPRHGASARLPGSSRVYFTGLSTGVEVEDNTSSHNSNDYDRDHVHSPEVNLHLSIYRRRQDVNAVFHARSPLVYVATRDGVIDTVHAEATLVLSDIMIVGDDSPEAIASASVGEPLRPVRVIVHRDEVYSIGACIHEARAFMEIIDEWARVKVMSSVLGGARYPITLERLRSVGARYARSIKFGGRGIVR
ncbi:MAG: class II aldolase/adducin family protein [Candidatus Nitrosocaldus sp.]|nr:class II aldolase/adducin family protein [Candidatus Nitrosocaldus sp.]MDW8000889.1 class II aldolase/adducin family protein [Candidatus Nitrosocaldus sp.]